MDFGIERAIRRQFRLDEDEASELVHAFSLAVRDGGGERDLLVHEAMAIVSGTDETEAGQMADRYLELLAEV